MTRGLHVDVLTAIQSNRFKAIALLDLDFESGHVSVTSYDKTISYGGNSFLGVGSLGSISPIEEATDNKAQGINLELSGISLDNIAVALGEHYQGRLGRLYIAFLDQNETVIGEPNLIFQGLMDNQNIFFRQRG